MTTRQLCKFFFTPTDEATFKCNICGLSRRQAARTGFSNLLSHLAAKHPAYQDEYAGYAAQEITRLEAFGFVDEDLSNIYDWMRFVVERNLALSEVENPLTRQLVRMQPITTANLKRHMRHVADRVGRVISAEMGDKFGIMFDGWSCGSLHFMGMYAVYWFDGKRHQRMIGLSPMEDGQSADAHVEQVSSVLEVYNKSLASVTFLVGDNCATNQCFATKMGVPLVGCASHRFNLAVNKFLSESEDLITQIQTLMTTLRQPNNAAELARHTTLRAVRANATRWSSVFEMLDRYVNIRDAIMRVATVDELVPRGPIHPRIVALHEKLVGLDSVCKKLQLDGRTMAEVRVLFDACIEMYPLMGEHLAAGAKIVHSPVFESAAVKVANEAPLTAAETRMLAPFVENATTDPKAAEKADGDFATEILRRAKKARRSERVPVTYTPLLTAIPPTSNRCERLFSECKFVLAPHRSGMHPANFEMLMFLKANRDKWNAATLMGLGDDE